MVANSAAAAADNYNTGGFRIPPLPVELNQYLDPITNPTWPAAYTSTGFQQATPAPPAGLPPLSALFGPPGPPPAPTHRQMHDADSADELDFFECFD
jgi:hypothetical protein